MKSKTSKQSKKSEAIVQIDWLDHFSNSYQRGWKDGADLKPVTVSSFGQVLDENKDVVALAQNVSDEGHYGNVINILKKVIVKRKILK